MARGAAGIAAGVLPHPRPGLVAELDGIGAWGRRQVALEVEARRLFPWIAVALGLGILLYFGVAIDGRPSPVVPGGLAAAAGGLAWRVRARPVGRAAAVAAAALLFGFAAAALRVETAAAPILARAFVGELTGFVEALEERDEAGPRLLVRVATLGDLGPAERPRRVRASLRKAGESIAVRPGDFVAARVRLVPPPEPARPGGYDFARDAYFAGIGAVGSLLTAPAVRPPPETPPLSLRLAARVDDARNALTRRMADAIGGQAGAVAASLVTGKRGLIDADTNDVLRAAGIYHVVSISGLHMVLAAGVVFWLVRAGLALVPGAALVLPIKKIAAAFGMVGVTAYCVFAGWDIAAERSLIMVLIMLGSTLVDRPALSLRNLALAALIALAREPEGLLGPSFQMSFAAVAGLVAFARYVTGRPWSDEGGGWLWRGASYLAASLLATLATTLVATVATAPFSTYHFQNLNPFGLIGNALTLPLVSLAVMPAAVIGILAYPLALDAPVWWLMGQAVRGMLGISAWIATFDHAVVVLPAFGAGVLGLHVAAILVATLPVSRLRWLALAPALAALAVQFGAPQRYDLYVDREGGGAVLRGTGGFAVVGRPSDFVLQQWLRADGDGRETDDASLKAGVACDRLGCTAAGPGGALLALVRDRRAFDEDCRRAGIIVSRLRAPPRCGAALVLDRAHLAAHGATAIRLEPDGRRIVATARRPGETRPWWPRPEPALPGPVPPAPTPAPPRRAVPDPDEPAPDEPDAAGED